MIRTVAYGAIALCLLASAEGAGRGSAERAARGAEAGPARRTRGSASGNLDEEAVRAMPAPSSLTTVRPTHWGETENPSLRWQPPTAAPTRSPFPARDVKPTHVPTMKPSSVPTPAPSTAEGYITSDVVVIKFPQCHPWHPVESLNEMYPHEFPQENYGWIQLSSCLEASYEECIYHPGYNSYCQVTGDTPAPDFCIPLSDYAYTGNFPEMELSEWWQECAAFDETACGAITADPATANCQWYNA